MKQFHPIVPKYNFYNIGRNQTEPDYSTTHLLFKPITLYWGHQCSWTLTPAICMQVYNMQSLNRNGKSPGLRQSLKMGQSRPFFCLFSSFQHKSIFGVLGIRTRSGRMEGADESTELRRHPKPETKFKPTFPDNSSSWFVNNGFKTFIKSMGQSLWLLTV